MSAKLLKEINQRIKEEGNIEEIVELDLGDLRIPAISDDIEKLLDKAKNLEILILADNDLENVNNLPKLDLTVLELSSNK